MDKNVQSMIENLKEKTGNSLGEWKVIIAKEGLSKHGEIFEYAFPNIFQAR